MADDKAAVRAALRASRRAMPAVVRASEAAAAVAVCRELAAALAPPALASYAALPDELDLSALHRSCWDAGRPVLLPRVAGPGELTWHAVRGVDELVAGSYGIQEPDSARLPATTLPAGTLLLVPGTGFTRDGHRLGQGGGFYDRLLAGPTPVVAVGVGFACQLRPSLPLEPHDRPLAGLVIAGSLVRDPRQA